MHSACCGLNTGQKWTRRLHIANTLPAWRCKFITITINFLIIAAVRFIVIRAMNRLMRQQDTDVPKTPEIPADVKLLSEISSSLIEVPHV